MKTNGARAYAITIIIAVLFTAGGWFTFRDFPRTAQTSADYIRARVQSVANYTENVDVFHNVIKTVYFTAEITEGEDKGAEIPAVQDIGGAYAAREKEISAGDRIFVAWGLSDGTGEEQLQFAGYDRGVALLLLCAAFFGIIVLIGGVKGVNTILSLTFTCLAIFLVYIPSLLSGMNVYASTVVVSVYIIFMSLMLINGPGKKTLCAVLGNLGGVAVAAGLASLSHIIMKMTGFSGDDAMMLSLSTTGVSLDILGIVWGGIVLGSLGAIMDVAMSIASAMQELGEHMTQKSFTKMFKSGLNIGRDAIGTMTNTLILAYIGSSLALVLVLIMNSNDTSYLLSTEMIAAELLQSVAGSMGILFAVPFTALFAARIYTR